MKKNTRLFLFAAYDKANVIDDTLLHYLNSLSNLGDIILTIDSDIDAHELSKLESVKNIIHVKSGRHHEYDFGSYKRGFQYAQQNNILKNYDWVYFVNDSVYGPLWDIQHILTDLESRDADLIGMIDFTNKELPNHVQSWFVGMSQNVVKTDFFTDFINNITRKPDKTSIIFSYEVGLSQIILHHGYKISTFASGQDGERCHSMYEEPLEMLKSGMPFIKKLALAKINKSALLSCYTCDETIKKIYNHAQRVYGYTMADINARQEHKYKKIYRLTIFSIPVLTVYKKELCGSSYKICIFDKIPVVKIARS